jgi:serine/threonine protein kinase/tetratricopeptide (TPR) repeat protein
MEDSMAPQTVGGYEVIRPLGAGGMGEVLLARDPRLERMVALKVLHRDFAVDPVARKRFHREAKALASLSHPGIVTIHEIGEDDKRDFIVMEFLRGKNLRRKIADEDLSLVENMDLARQIAEAVAGAHGAGVLHRDIKPENIMVDEEQHIKVVDFGLARGFHDVDSGRLPRLDKLMDTMGATLEVGASAEPADAYAQDTVPAPRALSSATDTILGTPGYMAPELFVGEHPTAASDVYSLGVLIFEMMTGKLPFVADSINALIEMRVYEDTEAARLDDEAGAPTDVADLVSEMLKNEPEDRPSIESVVERIEAVIEAATQKIGVVSTPRPPRALSQEIDTSPARRRRLILRLASVLVLGGALVAGVAIYRDGGNETTSKPKLDSKSIGVAVLPLDATLRSYANSNGHVSLSGADLLASLLGRVDAIEALDPGQLRTVASSPPTKPEDWERVALNAGAIYAVRGAMKEEAGQLTASVEITNLLNRDRDQLAISPRSDQDVDALLFELANVITAKVAPGSTIVAAEDEVKRSIDSIALYGTALQYLHENRWVPACNLLERIVKEQPDFFEAWYHLALAAAWAARPAEQAISAAQSALELARTERDRRLMEILILHYRRDQTQASEQAALLAKDYPNDPEIAYAHAETVYHDGRYAEGLELFDQALLLAPRSHLASAHPLGHAEANGHLSRSMRFRTLRGKRVSVGKATDALTHQMRFSLRRYSDLLEDDSAAIRRMGLSLLGKDKIAEAELAEEETLNGEKLLYLIASASEDGRIEEARAYFDLRWKELVRDANTAGNHLRITRIAEVLIAAELKDELRTFLTYWKLPDIQKEGTSEHSVHDFAAILLEDPDMIHSGDHLTWREMKQAQAARAELAGDHKKAVEIWRELLADPSQWGNYLEHLALGRNLFALGRRGELKKACMNIVYPRTWRPAYPAMRMHCRRWKAMPSRPPKPE